MNFKEREIKEKEQNHPYVLQVRRTC